MFFFFVGTTEKEALRGVVVDYCPVCRKLSPLSVLDHRRTLHLYFIPLGKGRYQGSTRRCVECGQYFDFDPQRYSEVLPAEEAEQLDVEQGLRRTTPWLAERFEAIDAIEHIARGPAYRGAADEPRERRLEEAADGLRELELRGVDSTRFCRRFAQWERFGESERQSLLAELRGYLAALDEAPRHAP
jgi:hypothetical protein